MTAALIVAGGLLLATCVDARLARGFEVVVAWAIAIPLLVGLAAWDLGHGGPS